MRIAVDALGGDNAPGEIVSGALAAARRLPRDEILLVGDEVSVRPLVPELPQNVRLKEARSAVGMSEDPAAALRARPDSSIAVAAETVRRGEAEAFFSAGSTGASVAAALLGIGRLKGCRRPAIATMLPFDKPALLLDAGATVACRPQDLLNFAILGGVFAKRYLRLDGEPRVGLVNVGEEPGKGDDLAKEAHALLEASEGVRFVGNVEGRDVGSGVADVLVTDGFTGNVVLKTAEGVAREILGMVRDAMTKNVVNKLAAAVLRPSLVAVRDRVDPENYGGSFLLGVRGPVVIGHGNSRARGVENAIVGISRAGSGLVEESEAALAAGRRSVEEAS
ncbi:phosphate acyltransferase PlsX [Rubrobacter marinus]|uniref:Phosphate acyltransferase n=1 Tax=Rubrobacter marinus TaxID=2653852 RepID=A0A6G8PXJ6_9ACTN|nr:phosphate acyltransferase PlsX [Rubrobacter marinus]QIN78952.1 phosphate acyltransferase PlsX [Rubrobacter marinus]